MIYEILCFANYLFTVLLVFLDLSGFLQVFYSQIPDFTSHGMTISLTLSKQ